jgi:hypothetical protein
MSLTCNIRIFSTNNFLSPFLLFLVVDYPPCFTSFSPFPPHAHPFLPPIICVGLPPTKKYVQYVIDMNIIFSATRGFKVEFHKG